MNAASTVLMLMVVTRTMGAAAGGVFSLAYAVAQQLMVIGHFEIRTYQVTDTEEVFSFGVYLAARIITTLLMIAGIIIYTLQSQGLSYEGMLYFLQRDWISSFGVEVAKRIFVDSVCSLSEKMYSSR